MNISSINNYAALSQADWFDRYGFFVRQNVNLHPIEPIAAIGRAIYDINDIDYDRISEFEKRIFSKNKTDKNDLENNKEIKDNKNTKKNNLREETKASGDTLTEEEKAAVEKLKVRDAEVRAHEQAHLSVAGSLATSGASYSYQQGPDGKQYAVGGEVNIDTSSEDSPEKTITKMQRVIAAAMAPAQPSDKDFSVAAAARKLIGNMKSQVVQNRNTKNDNNKIEITEKTNISITNSINSTDSINKSNSSYTINKTDNQVNNSIEFTSQNNDQNNQNSIKNNRNNISNRLDTYLNCNIFSIQQKGLYANFIA